MSARTLGCALMLILVFAVSAALADGTWYNLHEQYTIQEIEVAPGVLVPGDIWADDYVPTYEDLVSIGFASDDAQDIAGESISWGKLKICLSLPDPMKCLSEKNEG